MSSAFGARHRRVARRGIACAASANGALHTSLGRSPRIGRPRGGSANGAIHRGRRRIPAFCVEGGGGQPVDAGEDGVFGFVAGLHAGALEVGEDEVLEVGQFGVAVALAGEFLGGDGFVVLERLDGEGAGDAEAFWIKKGLVVEGFFGGRFAIGDAAEGDVGHLLVNEALAEVAAREMRRAFSAGSLGRSGPRASPWAGMSSAFGARSRRVSDADGIRLAGRVPSANGALHISLGRSPRFIPRRRVSAKGAIHRGGEAPPIFGVVEQVVGKGGAEQPGLGDIEGDARGVGGDPAPPPLLGDIGGGARTARRVQYQVARVGGHQDAALDDLLRSLNHIEFVSASRRIIPNISYRVSREVIEIPEVSNCRTRFNNTARLDEAL
jgi:hypothetical protein